MSSTSARFNAMTHYRRRTIYENYVSDNRLNMSQYLGIIHKLAIIHQFALSIFVVCTYSVLLLLLLLLMMLLLLLLLLRVKVAAATAKLVFPTSRLWIEHDCD